MCEKPEPGPANAPSGAVTVDPSVPGDLSAKTDSHPAGTTFWLKPGRHRLADDRYAQVEPKDGNTYIGAPGAVLDGRRTNQYAFGGGAHDVTVRHLTVQGFVAPHDEGVVNHDSADGWVVEHSRIQYNSGAGLMAGSGQQVRASCLRGNGQYGMNAYKGSGPLRDLVLEGNEITGNNRHDWERKRPGCGCTGGVKFWAVDGADVRGNWVHDNRGTGLWADTNNNDFLIEGNVLEDNDGAALMYETSYNAVVRDNTIRRNNWVEGRRYAERGDTFPFATVYVSESGGEPRVKARTDKLEISGNLFEDNWNAITLWENADRFCNSPANTSSADCTLLVEDIDRCARPGIASRAAVRRLPVADPAGGHPRQPFPAGQVGDGLHVDVRPHGGARQLRHLSGLVAVHGREGRRRDHAEAAQPLAEQRLRGAVDVRRARPERGAGLPGVAGRAVPAGRGQRLPRRGRWLTCGWSTRRGRSRRCGGCWSSTPSARRARRRSCRCPGR